MEHKLIFSLTTFKFSFAFTGSLWILRDITLPEGLQGSSCKQAMHKRNHKHSEITSLPVHVYRKRGTERVFMLAEVFI